MTGEEWKNSGKSRGEGRAEMKDGEHVKRDTRERGEGRKIKQERRKKEKKKGKIEVSRS